MLSRALTLSLPFLLLAFTASAPEPGGWAVITLEDLPEHLVAGTPVELTYTVRQHGQTLVGGVEGTIRASAGGQSLEVVAKPGEREGEYRARLTVPESGLWTFTIRSQVIPGFAKPVQATTLLPIEAVGEGQQPHPVSDAERGQALFVAKGCAQCHVHRGVDAGGIRVGPELTGKRYAADYLALYLADPSIRAATTSFWPMPDLGLGPEEIIGLTAFLNAEDETLTGAGR